MHRGNRMRGNVRYLDWCHCTSLPNLLLPASLTSSALARANLSAIRYIDRRPLSDKFGTLQLHSNVDFSSTSDTWSVER
jgi:hypothetical protein